MALVDEGVHVTRARGLQTARKPSEVPLLVTTTKFVPVSCQWMKSGERETRAVLGETVTWKNGGGGTGGWFEFQRIWAGVRCKGVVRIFKAGAPEVSCRDAGTGCGTGRPKLITADAQRMRMVVFNVFAG